MRRRLRPPSPALVVAIIASIGCAGPRPPPAIDHRASRVRSRRARSAAATCVTGAGSASTTHAAGALSAGLATGARGPEGARGAAGIRRSKRRDGRGRDGRGERQRDRVRARKPGRVARGCQVQAGRVPRWSPGHGRPARTARPRAGHAPRATRWPRSTTPRSPAGPRPCTRCSRAPPRAGVVGDHLQPLPPAGSRTPRRWSSTDGTGGTLLLAVSGILDRIQLLGARLTRRGLVTLTGGAGLAGRPAGQPRRRPEVVRAAGLQHVNETASPAGRGQRPHGRRDRNRYLSHDASAPRRLGSGCAQVGPQEVSCTSTPNDVVLALLGDGDDPLTTGVDVPMIVCGGSETTKPRPGQASTAMWATSPQGSGASTSCRPRGLRGHPGLGGCACPGSRSGVRPGCNVLVDGEGGNDLLDGAAGADSLSGGPGGDFLHSPGGPDALDGGDGDDCSGYQGADRLGGGEGEDAVGGGAGNDYEGGGSEDDRLGVTYVRGGPPGGG